MAGKNVVALYSVTGLLGSALLTELAKAHEDGKFTLVVITRAGSNTSKVPASVEKRVLNYGKSSQEETEKALAGVDILVSAVDKVSLEQHYKFLEQISKVKTLSAFIPSDYSVNWTKAELAAPGNTIVSDKVLVNDKAKELGVPLAVIHNGLFSALFLLAPVSGVDVKGNKLALYGDALNRKLPLTSVNYQGKAIAELVAGDKSKLAGTLRTIVELEASGQEVADELAKVNGAKPALSKITDAEIDSAEQQGPGAVLGAQIRKKWGAGTFPLENPLNPQGVKTSTLSELIASAK